MKIKLTQSIIDKGLECPSDRRSIEYVDQDQPGLYIQARHSSNNHSYYLRYTSHTGCTAHQRLGRVAEISLKNARSKARDLRSRIADGYDPRAESNQRKGIPTCGEFFTQHYEPYARSRKRTASKDSQMWNNRISSVFGNTRMDLLSRKSVTDFHASLLEKEGLSGATADHHLKLLKRMANLAVDWSIIQVNPIASVKPFNLDNKREYYLSSEEIGRLVTVCKSHQKGMVGQLVLALLATGCRLNELTRARWEHYDAEKQLLTIPMENSKSAKRRTVYLNDEAISILEGLQTRGNSKYLFINQKTGEPLKWVHKGWNRIREKASLPEHVTMHSLRHSFASMCINSGRTLYEVQQLLGHSSPDVTTRYAHLAPSTLSAASNSAGEAIRKAANE